MEQNNVNITILLPVLFGIRSSKEQEIRAESVTLPTTEVKQRDREYADTRGCAWVIGQPGILEA